MIDNDELNKLISEHFISVRKHPQLDLWIYNYTPKCQYHRVWNEITTKCRGLIMDSGGNVIANPFSKFFNLGEEGMTMENLPSEIPQITEKVSGSLGVLYDNASSPAVSTRGSFESPMAVWGSSWLSVKGFEMSDFKKEYTYLFEIIYKENKIICDYNTEELVLLAVRHTLTGNEINHIEEAERLGITPVNVFNLSLNEAIAKLNGMKGEKQEGFVVKYNNGLRVKLKCDDYVRIHRIISGFSRKHIIEAMENGNTMFLNELPDELHNEAKAIINEIEEKRELIMKSAKAIAKKAKKLETRKEQALLILQSKYPGVSFPLLDNNLENAINAVWTVIKKEEEK
jgi:RNA ligase